MRNSSGLLLALSATLLLLSACGGSTVSNPVTPSTPTMTPSAPASTPSTPSAPAAVTVASVSVTSSTATPVVGSLGNLKVTVKGSDGSTLTDRTVTYTSSNPQAVAVNGGGGLLIRHLGPVGVPITITATADGVSGTTTVTPWGLDVAGGTYNHPADHQGLGSEYFMRFRNMDSSVLTSNTPFSISRPDATTYAGNLLGQYEGVGYGDPAQPQSGTYRISTVINGQTFSQTFTIDASQVIAAPSDISVGGDATTAQVSGVLPAGAISILVYAYMPNNGATGFAGTFYSLPNSSTWKADGSALPSGTYSTRLYAYSGQRTSDSTTPDMLNAVIAPGPTLNF